MQVQVVLNNGEKVSGRNTYFNITFDDSISALETNQRQLLFVAVSVFEPAMCFVVVLFVFFFWVSEVADVPLQLSLREEDAGALWAFVQLVVVAFSHG